MALLLVLILTITTTTTTTTVSSQPTPCRTKCGPIPISYPFGIDPGCGSPYYHSLLTCGPPNDLLLLRTPSGSYPVHYISYPDQHIIVSDHSMWSCSRFSRPINTPPFTLDSSTRLKLSDKNDFLFFNCSEDTVIVKPRPQFCDRFPERCESVCDSAGYLCRNLPSCPEKLRSTETRCCVYSPSASESVRMMMGHCEGYTSLYWKTVRTRLSVEYDQVPEYGLRVDFDVPVTTKCQRCRERGGGVCGYDGESRRFLCLCGDANVTSYCGDKSLGGTSAGVIAGTVAVVSIAGLASGGVLIWFWKKMRSNKVVACGIQTTENRLF